jgi:peptidoglycan DL-endopeptidase CwlO
MTRLRACTVAALLLSSVTITSSVVLNSATAAPSSPLDHIRQVEEQVNSLQMAAASASEVAHVADDRAKVAKGKADKARVAASKKMDAVRVIQGEMAELQVKLTAAQVEEVKDKNAVDAIAATAYMQGSFSPLLTMTLTSSAQSLMRAVQDLHYVAQSGNKQLADATAAKNKVAFLQSSLVAKQMVAQQASQVAVAAADEAKSAASDASSASATAKAEWRKVNVQLGKAKTLLSSLKAAERKRLAAIEKARKAAEQKAIRDAQNAAQNGGSYSSEGARIAVAYALSQVGKPYSMNAQPPVSWDCSKLTSAAWAKAGINLTPYSFTQYDEVRHIPVSEMRAGDLVFYFKGEAHHVGIYIGNGLMVQAANPSIGVVISDPFGPWLGEHFTGVGRPE